MVTMCKCGEPVFIKKAGQCRRCYMREYQRARYVPRERKPKPYEPQQHKWRMDICYTQAHKRVGNVYGKASTHTCVGCGNAAHVWAYDHGDSQELSCVRGNGRGEPITVRYSPRPEHYQPMCHACHRAYDLGDNEWTPEEIDRWKKIIKESVFS